jgi:hypothetical protein
MPHRRKKSLVDDRPPKRRGANRRKAQSDPTSETYQAMEEDRTRVRTKKPRKTSASKRKRSGGARKERGKKTVGAKAKTQRRARSPRRA